jgi:hypothetical protein
MRIRGRELAESFFRHFTWHGVVAIIIAVVALILLRGLNLGTILLFGFPPAFAALHIGAGFSWPTRLVAWAFLGMIGLGDIVAHVPRLFPRLGGVEPQLALWQDRMLTWYAGVYLIWFFGTLPMHLFGGSLLAHRKGLPAPFSRPTCYLALATMALLWIGFPRALAMLGFWPLL